MLSVSVERLAAAARARRSQHVQEDMPRAPCRMPVLCDPRGTCHGTRDEPPRLAVSVLGVATPRAARGGGARRPGANAPRAGHRVPLRSSQPAARAARVLSQRTRAGRLDVRVDPPDGRSAVRRTGPRGPMGLPRRVHRYQRPLRRDARPQRSARIVFTVDGVAAAQVESGTKSTDLTIPIPPRRQPGLIVGISAPAMVPGPQEHAASRHPGRCDRAPARERSPFARPMADRRGLALGVMDRAARRRARLCTCCSRKGSSSYAIPVMSAIPMRRSTGSSRQRIIRPFRGAGMTCYGRPDSASSA
jgi:hypothetical protein